MVDYGVLTRTMHGGSMYLMHRKDKYAPLKQKGLLTQTADDVVGKLPLYYLKTASLKVKCDLKGKIPYRVLVSACYGLEEFSWR